MSQDARGPGSPHDISDDVKVLHSMGYAQELLRRMSGFSNFAISFSIICILSGGINSLGQGIGGVGGAAIGIGWPLGCLVSLIFALGMGQIASAYPTAGGLYHWGSILGGRALGWFTAWFNLIGLIAVLAAINVGTFLFVVGAFGAQLGLEANAWTQFIFLALLTGSHALLNHLGIRVTTLLTDLSGYLIFLVAVALTIAFLAYAPAIDISRLWTFTNYSGPAGGDVWPQHGSLLMVFLLGLLLPIYTITGFDASAHTSEETVQASHNVPRSMVRSVVLSAVFGYAMLVAFVLAIPNMDEAAAQGWNVFFWTSDAVLPAGLKYTLYFGIAVSQYLCGLATVTSVSRMIFAFARDGGLPASASLRKVSPTFRTPVAAIWTGTALAVLLTVYADLYSIVVSVAVIFLFISYGLPVALGAWAYGRTWTQMGPWTLGGAYRLVAVLCVAAAVLIFIIGVQPPNEKALYITIAFLIITALVWFFLENRRFQGPPIGEAIRRRQAEIAAAEQAVGETTGAAVGEAGKA
ncbi:amino acid permease [Inquilinus sp. NPDC058860]|uniref:amino acid permease n=1 Tax=Inquilinus sp. NPDC058860 TaxID=3346652 RepID=UPI0036BD245E